MSKTPGRKLDSLRYAKTLLQSSELAVIWRRNAMMTFEDLLEGN